jgi:hypothetical protein
MGSNREKSIFTGVKKNISHFDGSNNVPNKHRSVFTIPSLEELYLVDQI